MDFRLSMIKLNSEFNLLTRIYQTIKKKSAIKYILSLILMVFSISQLMVFSGVKFSIAISLVLIVICQILPGSLLWYWTNQNRILNFSELLGMGLALGTLLALLSAHFFALMELEIMAGQFPP